MGLFDFLKVKTHADKAKPAASETPLTEQAIFDHPIYLALWVNKYFLQNYPLEKNYELLPSDESRVALGITFAQRERCAREYSVLRIAGVSWFIKSVYDDVFWLTFSKNIAAPLAKHLFADNWKEHVEDTAEALDRYVALSISEKAEECAQFYLTRIFDDNEKFLQMKLAGIGLIACDQTNSSFEIMADAYDTVTSK